MQIRKAKIEELDALMQIYDDARAFMRKSGNPEQWRNHPPRELIEEDISRGCCHVCEEDGELFAVFYFCEEDDPTYRVIDGAWLNERPYGVVHRIAVAKRGRGVASFCFDYAFSRCGNLKIDTHRQNIPMQRALEKNGFVLCGVIRIASGDERIAYQKTDACKNS
ncbi:MAG: GNAT family N-acetyltransferase [Clostridia bacterium]|nr:GNAT family N-acetyltransferase [Clostridia bacterium]